MGAVKSSLGFLFAEVDTETDDLSYCSSRSTTFTARMQTETKWIFKSSVERWCWCATRRENRNAAVPLVALYNKYKDRGSLSCSSQPAIRELERFGRTKVAGQEPGTAAGERLLSYLARN